MEWKVDVFVDYREKYIKEYFEKNREYDSIVSVKNLEIGDIVILVNDEPAILIERKTIKDLASSIQDGRLREQKYRITGSKYPHKNVIFLIEGDLDEKIYGRIDKRTLQGSIINTMLRDDYKVYRTKDPKDTVFFLSRLIAKIMNDRGKLLDLTQSMTPLNLPPPKPKQEYSELVSLSKKSQLTPETFNKVILLQISGISIRHVNEIQKDYPNIKELILKYESIENIEERQDLLSQINIGTTTGKKRKIGFIMSKRIYDYFYP
jgi:crossover junction endonuclease MUS81